jgi:general L-amino acid transport system substrate-binding protein
VDTIKRRFSVRRLLAGVMGAGLIAAATPALAQAPAAGTNLIETIRTRGQLICGVSTGLAGFSAPDSQGRWTGFDVDYCRAVAVAIFGTDQNRVRFVATTAQARFTALQSGEVDMLARNTTWTLSRDTSLGLDFPATSFYDGQGFMVKRSLGVTSARQLDGATVCVQPGTTTEQNLTDWARANRVTIRPVVIERQEDNTAAYNAGRCDAYTTDASGLAAVRSTLQNPNDHIILPEIISKEPLGPLVRHGDQRFADLVRWTHFALIAAEELGLTSANVEAAATGDQRPEVARMLGRSGDLGQMLGVDNRWVVNLIKIMGNYGEVFDRNLTPLGLQRGPNALWTTPGGLQYAPPFR